MLDSQNPPLAQKERLTAKETSFGGLTRDPDADQRIGGRGLKPSIDPHYPYRFGERQLASGRPSIGRRIFRTLTRFSIAALVGVAATLGWQFYSDAAREMLVARAPTLAWVLSVSTRKSPVDSATAADPMQQLAPLASNLDFVRRSVEQLAAKQEQMVQSIAAIQAVEEDIKQKVSSTPPAPAQQAASVPQPKLQPKAHSSAVSSSLVPRPPPPAGPQLSR